ncbi:MAG: PAS domain S-box protein [Bacteroidales bacterium]|nr:MAG: PAS domain S-box protein [Bacteroidales bacterium]
MKTTKLKSKETTSIKTPVKNIGKFPIVCIGASAGGLEAFEQYLENVPENSGMAYIVIQHLDPTQKGMLPELLQRITHLKVLQAKDRVKVRSNIVYVIPPNKTMSILKGVLHLFEPIEARGLRLPIDHFLQTLADDQHEHAVGVILSGMGSDGSIGIRAIKEHNGIVMVQEPTTAKFDSMPRSAIESVLADIIAPADELPLRLNDFFKHIPLLQSDHEIEIKDKSSLEKIIILLRSHTGNDFSLYKKNTVYRRIERRMGVHKIEKITSYVHFLQENPKEMDILFKELLIGVTNFFRDSEVWEKLKETIIPDLIAKQQEGSILRAWAPACSTGEEAYSLAIAFKEAIEKRNSQKGITLQIFATDLDSEAIETARKGLFSANIAANVSPKRLSRFFIKAEEGYRVNTEIREMVVFAKHNIIMHAPFTKIDILTCRNMLIYMDPVLQKKLLGLFCYSLNPDGIMVLGSAETLGTQSHFFTPVDGKLKIYKRSITTQVPELFDFPSSFSKTTSVSIEKLATVTATPNIQALTDQLLLQHFSPPGVLVNEKGDIIYISGRTGKYLEPSVGKANMNIFAMLRDGLRNEFPAAFRKAIKKHETVTLHNVRVGTNGGTQNINVIIQWIEKPEALNGMVMIIFIDLPKIVESKIKTKQGEQHLHSLKQSELEEELQRARNEMQNALEEMQTTQEEQKSTNEELQSTNEELQSTNEELTTSKEEMQSLNEELQTVNAELQSKVDDFLRVNNDMKNLLNSTDIATLFLDKELNIRRFTNQATKIFKLIKSDIGRPFTDLVSDLSYPELSNDALEVLRTLVFIEKQIPTNDKRWFSIRIMPYRTYDDRIDGLVITFVNNSDIKKLEGALIETEQMHRLILNSSSDAIIRLTPDLNILEFNPEAEKFFGKKHKTALNKNFIQLVIPQPKQKKVEKDLKKILYEGVENKLKIEVVANGGKIAIDEWTVNVLLDNHKKPAGMILIYKKSEDRSQESGVRRPKRING